MYMGKDLTEVRSPHRPLVPDGVGPEQYEPTFLRGIAEKARVSKHHRFQDLYRHLDAEFLLYCWRYLNKGSASGVDQVTASEYAKELHANIEALAQRLKAKRYRAKLVRRVYIPKEDGRERPIGIPALEDKLVQAACARLLEAIYEQDFEPCSYGYRRGRSPGDAVRELTFDLQYGVYGHVVEADIRGFFDHLDHDWLERMLAERIDDGAFLGMIRKWLKAGILDTEGSIIDPDTGTPQGGVISPILANVYLHHALDLWFERVVKPRCRGGALMCRYADDWVCAFRYEADARRYYAALPKRLAKFGLEVAGEKTRVLRFSRFHPGMARRFTFLGFEFAWLPDRKGVSRVKRRTGRKKLQAACSRIKTWIREHRHTVGAAFFAGLNRRLRGHYQYYGVRGNSRSLYRFYAWAVRCTYKWLNRRGGKRRSFNWPRLKEALARMDIARPHITEVRRPRVFAT